MKEVNKLKKIYQGFFGEEVSEEISSERRSKCNSCEFNSVNAEKLSLINNIRNTFTPPFCTLCSCQIEEKTGSPLEECAMYMIGEEKKWYKIKIETMENENLNLIQIGENKYDISIVDDNFVIDLKKVEVNKNPVIEVLFQLNEGKKMSNVSFGTSCGCTTATNEPVDERTVKSIIKINVGSLNYGAGSKTVIVSYMFEGKAKTQKVKLKYYRI